MKKLYIVDVGSIGGTHVRGEVVTPKDFPAPGQWPRLLEIGAVRLETAAEAEARLGGDPQLELPGDETPVQ